MNKAEFLYALQGRLAETLPREKVEEHIRYYDSYIMEGISKGMTEEETVSRLGDPLLIAKTIMDTSDESVRQRVIYEDGSTSQYSETEDRWEDQRPQIHHFKIQTKGGCLLAAIILIVVVALILWLVGSVVSFLLPVLVPVAVVVLVISYMKQK